MKNKIDKLLDKHNEIINKNTDIECLKHYISNQVSPILLSAQFYIENTLIEKTEENEVLINNKLEYNYQLLLIIESKLNDDSFLLLIKFYYKNWLLSPKQLFIQLGLIEENTLKIIK